MKIKVVVWVWGIFAFFVGICLLTFLILASQSSRPYDERSFLLIMAVLCFLMCKEIVGFWKEAEKKVKEHKTQEVK